jgi:hypothetical protein
MVAYADGPDLEAVVLGGIVTATRWRVGEVVP